MTLQNHGTYKDKLQIYVHPSKKEIIEKTKKLLKAEGSSLSQFLISKIEEYYKLHEPGNPQQHLDVLFKIGHAYHAETCQLCKATPTRFGLKNGVWLGYCLNHWEVKRFRTWK